MSKKKSSQKTTVDDFLSLLMEEENCSQPVAFAPVLNSIDVEKEITIEQQSAPADMEEIFSKQKTSKKQATIVESKLSQTTSESKQSLNVVGDKPLGSRETGVSSALGKPLGSRETDVSSALGKPLGSRETGVRQIENSALDIEQLVGKEKTLLLIIHDECKKLGELETNFIGTDSLKKLLNLDSLGLRNLVFRVKEKGFFEVTSKQLGRVGIRKFKISRTIYQQILSSELDRRETGVSSALDKPLDKPLDTPPYSSSNNLNINTNTGQGDQLQINYVPENLSKFGISTINLQRLISSGKTTQEVVERSLAALSFDVHNGKSGNLANILFGVLGTGREYISQKYSESLQQELDEELARMNAAEEAEKKLHETKLKRKFMEYVEQNPDFLDSVKLRNNKFINNAELIEKMAFEEFRNTIVHATK